MNDARSAAAAQSSRTSRALLLASAIALVHTAWALFQWYELIVARRGGDIVCVGGGHCAEVWSSPFASAVHARTGMPVAAWGVVWGIAAFLLPAIARVRLARRREVGPWIGATLLTALAGVVGAAVLLAASLAFGHLCTTCAATYALVLVYVAVAFVGLGLPPVAALLQGAPLALGIAAVAVAVLYLPGRHTPQSMAETGTKSLQSLAPEGSANGGPQTDDERMMTSYIASLSPDMKQLLSDTLAAYAAAPIVAMPPARTVIGPESPRVAITEFSDTLCGHCAQMQLVLKALREQLGPDAFSLAPHQYPLDAACNSNMKGGESHPLRCVAAKVQICAEGAPNEFEVVSSLFENQATLTDAKLWELAQPLGPRAELEACTQSPETEKKLQDDITWAQSHGIQGTPFLFIGGRQVIAYPPLIFVLALTHGAPSHPAFASLPAPQPLPWEK